MTTKKSLCPELSPKGHCEKSISHSSVKLLNKKSSNCHLVIKFWLVIKLSFESANYQDHRVNKWALQSPRVIYCNGQLIIKYQKRCPITDGFIKWSLGTSNGHRRMEKGTASLNGHWVIKLPLVFIKCRWRCVIQWPLSHHITIWVHKMPMCHPMATESSNYHWVSSNADADALSNDHWIH